jgi:hypothetical protein
MARITSAARSADAHAARDLTAIELKIQYVLSSLDCAAERLNNSEHSSDEAVAHVLSVMNGSVDALAALHEKVVKLSSLMVLQ